MAQERGRARISAKGRPARRIDRVAALATLNEPARRRIYELAAKVPEGVSRDGVAEALGLSRSAAAFHLDKLARAGLLDVSFRRPPGRGGPGAGRPAKWYRRAAGEISLSVPERRYDLAASLLARAVELARNGSLAPADALVEVARAHGRRLGADVRGAGTAAGGTADAVRAGTATTGGGTTGEDAAGEAATGGVPGGGSSGLIERLVGVLAAHGYEPQIAGGVITLANCPFHSLAEEHRELVCGMNHALLCGLAEEAGLPRGSARLDPAPGRCCVTLVA